MKFRCNSAQEDMFKHLRLAGLSCTRVDVGDGLLVVSQLKHIATKSSCISEVSVYIDFYKILTYTRISDTRNCDNTQNNLFEFYICLTYHFVYNNHDLII